jgi:hypothetical protein
VHRHRRPAAAFALLALGLLLLGAIPSTISASPLTDIGSSRNPAPACTPITFSAVVYGIIPPPLGGVIFLDGVKLIGAELLSPDFDHELGVPVPTNHSSASVTTSLGEGTHFITFTYDSTAGAGVSQQLVEEVTAAESTTEVTSSVDPSVFGQPVDLSADVSSSCSGSVAGSVQFRADGTDIGGPQAVGGSGHVSITTSDLAVGLHEVQAVFTSSDPDVSGSTGTLFPSLTLPGQLVNRADTTTTVSSSTDPSEFGVGVTFTAATTVNAPGAGTISGTVQFQDNGADIGSPVTVDGAGHAAIATSTLSVGDHVIDAAFTSSSPNFNDSAGNLTQTVDKARTTLTYDGVTSADYHDTADLSATLTRTVDGAPIAGKTVDVTMASEHCSAPSDVHGKAACTIIPTEPAGVQAVAAAFGGDGDFLASNTSRSFEVTKEETTTTYTGPTVIAQGSPVTLSGRVLEDGIVPISGRTLTLTLGSGTGSQTCDTGPTDAAGNGSCIVTDVSVGQGPEPVVTAFAGDAYYLPSTDADNVIVFAFPDRGVFALGDRSAAIGTHATYWGSQWAAINSLTGGSAPSAFKGFGGQPSSTPPACGGTWTTSPGNSASPVNSVPAYMGVAVSSSVTKHGNDIVGNIVGIIVVKTDPGYGSAPGQVGTGTVIATYCSVP